MTDLRFDSALKTAVENRLDGFVAAPQTDAQLQPAAVAIVLVAADRDPLMPGLAWSAAEKQDTAVVLTRRAAKLNNHAGQWALPGGRMEADETPPQAALRELDEEVGLRLAQSAVMGVLDDYPTRSGFRITPVVVWGGCGSQLTPNPHEVASIHRLPVRELLRHDAPWLQQLAASQHPVLRMPVGSRWIAAPTAAMLYQFREVAMRGQATRVAHFEQPYFAWK